NASPNPHHAGGWPRSHGLGRHNLAGTNGCYLGEISKVGARQLVADGRHQRVVGSLTCIEHSKVLLVGNSKNEWARRPISKIEHFFRDGHDKRYGLVVAPIADG